MMSFFVFMPKKKLQVFCLDFSINLCKTLFLIIIECKFKYDFTFISTANSQSIRLSTRM